MVRASRGRGSCVVVPAAVGEEGAPAGACDGPGVVVVACVFGTVVVPVIAVFWLGCDRGWVWDWDWDCPAEELGSMPFVCAAVAMVAVCGTEYSICGMYAVAVRY